MAVIAQEEREMISRRTKEALTAAKARGQQLGGKRPNTPPPPHEMGTAARIARAEQFASNVGPIAAGMRDRGWSLARVAEELTAQGIKTARGGKWTATAVRNVLARVQ